VPFDAMKVHMRLSKSFIRLRLPLYEKRLASYGCQIGHELLRLSNKARFVLMVANEELKVGNVDPETLDATLEELKFDRLAETEDARAKTDLQLFDTSRDLSIDFTRSTKVASRTRGEASGTAEVLRARTAIELWESDCV